MSEDAPFSQDLENADLAIVGLPLEKAAPYLEQVGLVLIMSVFPGFGGQSFIPDVLEKVVYRNARGLLERIGALAPEST